jgi:dTDP-4-amino-4,6-dideoxygalactose transaminase
MFDAKIETGIHYPPIHKMSLYNKNQKLVHTENASKHIVTLPTHPNLSNKEINYIIEIINREGND